jgi:hypothetical protein
LHLYFVAVFQALEQISNMASMQSVIISRLEARIDRLEQAVATDQVILTPPPRASSTWDHPVCDAQSTPNSPEMPPSDPAAFLILAPLQLASAYQNPPPA